MINETNLSMCRTGHAARTEVDLLFVVGVTTRVGIALVNLLVAT